MTKILQSLVARDTSDILGKKLITNIKYNNSATNQWLWLGHLCFVQSICGQQKTASKLQMKPKEAMNFNRQYEPGHLKNIYNFSHVWG